MSKDQFNSSHFQGSDGQYLAAPNPCFKSDTFVWNKEGKWIKYNSSGKIEEWGLDINERGWFGISVSDCRPASQIEIHALNHEITLKLGFYE